MKRTIISIVFAVLPLAVAPIAQCQTYNITRESKPINLQVNGETLSLVYPIGTSTITETAIIDAGNSLIRQFGSFSAPAFSVPSATYSVTEVVPPVFPNPPTTRSAEFTISFTLDNAAVPFDTGNKAISWNGSHYVYDDYLAGLWFPVTASWSILADGLTTTGTQLSYLSGAIRLGSEIDTANYPALIYLNQPQQYGSQPQQPPQLGLDANFSFLASNGVSLAMTMFAPVPEPSSFALIGVASITLGLMRRRLKG